MPFEFTTPEDGESVWNIAFFSLAHYPFNALLSDWHRYIGQIPRWWDLPDDEKDALFLDYVATHLAYPA